MKNPKSPSLIQALIPVFLLIFFLWLVVVQYKLPPHIAIIGGTVTAVISGLFLGYTWKQLENGLVHGIQIAMQACLILLVIGMLIGTWITAGIVPTMIYYGLKLLSPKIFLFATCLICSLVSLATGSSWSTAGTVGIALIGVGQGLGIPLPMVAGAIISGSYFGDKMSPLSDTTNLAPAVAQADMFAHIRHMIYTTGPSITISLILYLILGFWYSNNRLQTGQIDQITSVLSSSFNISPWLFIPPLLVIVMVILRVPALPALLGGATVGGMFALFFQNAALADVIYAAHSGFVSQSGFDTVDSLLTRGGLESMLSTIALIICALAFGGAMERTGSLQVITMAILKMAKSTGSLVFSTIFTCIFMNVVAGEQYLAIILPGRMYKDAYKKAGLAPKNLSRALEDGGTITSCLIPWNSGGAYMWATLGVYPFAFAPFAFLNIINPILSTILAYTGWTMEKTEVKKDPAS